MSCSALPALAVVLALMVVQGSPAAAQSSAPKGAAARSADDRGAADKRSTDASASPYALRYAETCAACHGPDGRTDQPGVPVLAGQHSFYAITQLFLFREGRRSDPAMSAVAKGMKDDDLRGFSQYIATLPPLPAPEPAEPADAQRMKRGETLAKEHKCVFCHGSDFSGGQQVPRIAGQHQQYLQMTLREFREGKRAGYTAAMAEAVGRISLEDLDTLAYYLARFPVDAPAKETKGTAGAGGIGQR